MSGETRHTTTKMRYSDIVARMEGDLEPVGIPEALSDLYDVLGVRCDIHAKLMRADLENRKQWAANLDAIVTAGIKDAVKELREPIMVTHRDEDDNGGYIYRTGISDGCLTVPAITLGMNYNEALEYADDSGATLYRPMGYQVFQSGDIKYDMRSLTWIYSGNRPEESAIEAGWNEKENRISLHKNVPPQDSSRLRGVRRIIYFDVPYVAFSKV